MTTGSTSSGSTISGLEIVNFAGAGIDVETSTNLIESNVIGASGTPNSQGVAVSGSDNTIGGTAAGAGNMIAYNTGAAIDVTSPSGSVNTLRGNLIYSDGSAIVTTSSVSPPTMTAAISSGGTTTIEGTFSTAPQNGTILDFYASSGSLAPAAIYLGSYVLNPAATSFTANLPVSVATGASISATATSPAGDTSAFSSPVAITNALQVTNTNDSGVGSLRQAIVSANANGGLATIVFDLSGGGPYTITLLSELPAIMNPVLMDATGLETTAGVPAVVINGGGLSGAGLTLGSDASTGSTSSGSTIAGLAIVDFAGAGIDVETSNNLIESDTIGASGTPNAQGVVVNGSNNTIGGTTTGAGNVIADNSGTAVDVTAGTGNVIRQNLIFGNGSGIVNPAGAPRPPSSPSRPSQISRPSTTPSMARAATPTPSTFTRATPRADRPECSSARRRSR